MADLDFTKIALRLGGQPQTFEELCCQLARRETPPDASYRRLHGAGGDGGVECFVDSGETKTAWQAKYVFKIGPLLTQLDASLTTALEVHTTLNRYIVCFPFDLTGPTSRRGKSGQEKFDEWRESREKQAAEHRRSLQIEPWPAHRLRELLMEYDVSGGLRAFFFDQHVLSDAWFSDHLSAARKTAGPRYTPRLNVCTDLAAWFSAFCRMEEWANEFREKVRACCRVREMFASRLDRSGPDSGWPDAMRSQAHGIAGTMKSVLDGYEDVIAAHDQETYRGFVERIEHLIQDLDSTESALVADLNARERNRRWDTPNYRQFMAEYTCSFPAAHVDVTREMATALRGLSGWCSSRACELAYEPSFILSGSAGAGKTHGICDVAERRARSGHRTCVAFGHEFCGDPDPWTRLLESLGLPPALGKEGLLDAMNAAGEASGGVALLCIDAINETRPLRYWRDRLASFCQAAQHRPYVRVCMACRTSFLAACVPEGSSLPVVEHLGFQGVQREACRTFFCHYGLEPPVAPLLAPELSNPLYLRLLCETLAAQGLRCLPGEWHGIALTMRSFLREKDRRFASEHDAHAGAAVVTRSMSAIAQAIAQSGEAMLAWSEAEQVVCRASPALGGVPVVDWLVREGLLIDDLPRVDELLEAETYVRPGFERLGDFLVAAQLLEMHEAAELHACFGPGGGLHFLIASPTSVSENAGVLNALAVLIPDRNHGVELPELSDEPDVRQELLAFAIRALPYRHPESLTTASHRMILEALSVAKISYETMDALITISWRPSVADAFWLQDVLMGKPLSDRDAYWCGYLHDRYDESGVVWHLIHAAFELPLEKLERSTAERWATVLIWCTASPDRRVKDTSTRAATLLFAADPRVLPGVLHSAILCDDDEVRERALLCGYGALILSRDEQTAAEVTRMVQDAFVASPERFDNALLRDHMRCLAELADTIVPLAEGHRSELTMRPIASNWPLELPSEQAVERWAQMLRFWADEFRSDFFKYSMHCLRPWEDGLAWKEMAEWILQKAARDSGYDGSRCDRYDIAMLSKYGGGRGKPAWAERIGKKYLWIAMYQLASRLHDHVERRQSTWDPEPLRTPLILLEERKLDPTLPYPLTETEDETPAWWLSAAADTGGADINAVSDDEWARREADVPGLDTLLQPVESAGESWRLLVSYPTWSAGDESTTGHEPYRHVWMMIHSYLVSREESDSAFACLHRRNFFGRWLPEGATFLYGFVGEYPWGTAFNTIPEEYIRGGSLRKEDVRFSYLPSWSQIAAEWEYDASIGRHAYVTVPARAFFEGGNLWYNRRAGYRLLDGRTVFLDPSVIGGGPQSLLAAPGYLLEWLAERDMQLIWTLLGQKQILGGTRDEQGRELTFSQVARLGADGTLRVGDLVFFEDWEQEASPSYG
jgi:hypothetical protein